MPEHGKQDSTQLGSDSGDELERDYDASEDSFDIERLERELAWQAEWEAEAGLLETELGGGGSG